MLLEAKLDSIDGLESRPRALQNADPVVGVQSGRKSKEEMPLESVANGNHGAYLVNFFQVFSRSSEVLHFILSFGVKVTI